MRILKVRFRNLNSLAGEWNIDLEAPEFVNSGIFAITGPTGSGKSTILDAICLALYGRTPRLGKVGRSGGNDIMTRHTRDCLAEVEFSTVHGRFVCLWKQSYGTRGSAVDKLRQPTHKLYNAKNEAEAEGITEVARKVEEITGMDYERFTQSTLLAQGSFASFLKAEGSERAPLLEKMTGTGIYRDISEHIYRRNDAEQKKLAALDELLKLNCPLSPEEETALHNACESSIAALAEMDARENSLSEGLSVLAAFAELEREHRALLEEKAAWEKNTADFKPDKSKLETARRAVPLSTDCAALLARKEEQRRDEKQRDSLNASLLSLHVDAEASAELCTASEKALSSEKQEQASLMQTLKQVRELDIRIKARAEELASRRDACLASEKEREQAEMRLSLGEKTLGELRLRMQEDAEWLGAHAADADLPQNIAAMRTSCTLMEQQDRRLETRAKTLDEKKEALCSAERKAEADRTSCDELLRERVRLEREAAELEQRRAEWLEGLPLAEWRSQKEGLERSVRELNSALDMLALSEELLGQAEGLRQKNTDLQEQAERANAAILSMQERLDETRQLHESLSESIRLIEHIRNYEEARRHLREGEACPLCGSVHHPFAEGLPAADGKKEQLQECTARLHSLSDELARQRERRAGLESDLAHSRSLLLETERKAGKTAASLLEKLHAMGRALPELAGKEGPAAQYDFSGLEHSLRLAQDDCALSLEKASRIVSGAEELEENSSSLRRQVEKARTDAERVAQEQHMAEQACASLSAEVRNLSAERDAEQAMFDQAFSVLRQKLTTLGAPVAVFADVPGVLKALDARSEAFRSRRQAAEQRMQERLEQEKICGIEKRNVESARELCRRNAEEEQLSADAHECLLKERRALFGDRDPDAEKKLASDRLLALEQRHESDRLALEACRTKKAVAEGRLSELEKRLTERAAQMEDEERALLSRLQETGFSGMQECLDACLTEEERDRLESTKSRLKDQAAKVEARLSDNERKKAELPELPESSEEELRGSLSELKARRAKMQEELGSLKEKLENSAQRKRDTDRLEQERTAQAEICRRWTELNLLVGSADGKKFRNYAQGLTFRMLIRHANRQLASMTDRYLLVQDEKEPLALSVIDRYQADAVRTSRNLSGGESFLVSLSLALGLARMASRSVRVDSVFLDEGFGTLDEDALNMALDMLSGLRQQGKTIGIISHVHAIRERIGVRIQVEPSGGGHSRLSGPGISQK